MIRSFAYDPQGGKLAVLVGFTTAEMAHAAADGGVFVAEVEVEGRLPEGLRDKPIREVQVVTFAAESMPELMRRTVELAGPGVQFGDGCGECESCQEVAAAADAVVEQAQSIAREAAGSNGDH